ncbi:hypothetical protein [Streptomyces sp900105245]|uniref:hypothetical protein n=1 Tax=unclassified Streptomyces TaxID=2593676 RepID=UPI003329AEE6
MSTWVLILGTPFLLDVLAPDDLDWGRLSDVSETYGGALSVLLSSAALAGVAAWRIVS